MQLDRNFVKTLNPPLSAMLKHGDIAAIAEALGKTPLTIRNAIHGASTNEMAIEEAIKAILLLGGDIEQFLGQIPDEVINRIRQKMPRPTAA